MKIRTFMASFVVACVALLGAIGSARADDAWFVLSEQTIKSADPSVAIKSAGGRWDKDVKQVKISVEGADVQITGSHPPLGQSQRRHVEGCRGREVRGANGSEGCSGNQGAPHGRDGPVQDPWRCADGQPQGLGI